MVCRSITWHISIDEIIIVLFQIQFNKIIFQDPHAHHKTCITLDKRPPKHFAWLLLIFGEKKFFSMFDEFF